MLSGLGGAAKAAIFYVITLGLALVVALFSGTLGEASLIVTMLTPAVAVVIMLLAIAPEGGLRAALASVGITRAGLRGWPFAILGSAAILLASYVILWATGLASFAVPAISRSVADVGLNMTVSLAVGLVLALGEEVGWRGYMLPRLAVIGLVPAMLIVGFLHGVWHLPLMLTTPYYHSGGNMMIVVPLFLVTLTLAGVFYGYLRVWTGSVWPAAIAHAVYNFVWGVLTEFTVPTSPEVLEYIGGESGILVIAGLAVFALIIVPRARSLSVAPAA